MRLNRAPLALVVYTERLPRIVTGGITLWRLILIRPKYRDDVGLLEHELVHVRQGARMLGYPFRRFRLALEAEAYREQLRHYPVRDRERVRQVLAERLATRYWLGITVEEARAALASG